tara:strand:+ start:511 stop:1227 length:717 start_codon:yes stop_codon:yes gene_type:complete
MFKVIPAIDLIDGKCVRLTQGNYNHKTEYNADPADLALSFLDAGISFIHVVDLDGAKIGSPQNLATVEKIAKTGIEIEFGGGLRKLSHLVCAIESGVRDLILGSKLISDGNEIQEWIEQFPGRLVAGIDVKDGYIAVSGWKKTSSISAIDLVQTVTQLGFSRIIYTDIATDGMLLGPNLEQLQSISQSSSIPVTASGGVGNIFHIQSVKQLVHLGIDGIIVGKAFYEGQITINEMASC